jgi:type II protein arginine methyltransferase
VRHKKSTELIVGKDIPKKADLIISEILSAEFVGEGVRTTLRDANQRLLHEDGKMIPESGEIMVGLLGDTPEIASQVRVERVSGFDLSLFNSISSRKFSFILNEKAVLLSEPQSAFKINLTNLERSVQENKILQLRVCADGICLGLIQWLRLQLFRDVGYENDPSKDSSHWPTPIYLFEKPIRVRIGDIVEVRAALTEDSVWFDQ